MNKIQERRKDPRGVEMDKESACEAWGAMADELASILQNDVIAYDPGFQVRMDSGHVQELSTEMAAAIIRLGRQVVQFSGTLAHLDFSAYLTIQAMNFDPLED